MNYLEQSIAELTARRCAAQTIVDQCDAGLVALRAILQPTLPLETVKSRRPRAVLSRSLGEAVESVMDAESDKRRAALLGLLKLGPVTFGELRRKVDKPRGRTDEQQIKDLSNTLQALKAKGTIRRDGNAWVLVP